MKTLVGGALAASILALAVPATAITLSNSPISIASVRSAPSNPETGNPGVVSLAFRNDAPVAASEVTFQITDDIGNTQSVKDVGSFATGVSIRSNFDVPDLADGAQARVVHVELADGSSWNDNASDTGSQGQDMSGVLGNLKTAIARGIANGQ